MATHDTPNRTDGNANSPSTAQTAGSGQGGIGSIFALPFALGVALMNRVNYGLKFVIIAAALFIPLGRLILLQYAEVTKQIDFNAKESIGIVYNDPVKDFLFDVQRRRLATAATFAGDTTLAAEVPAITSEADAKVALVDTNDNLYGGDDERIGLKTTKRWKEAKDAWAALKSATFKTATEADTAYAGLTSILNDVILNYAGNYSNLILDPDLDSYWLMDMYLIKMATLADAIARSSALGLTAALDASDADRTIELSALYKSIINNLSDIENIDLKTAFDFNNSAVGSKVLEKVLTGPFAKLKEVLTAHAETIRKRCLSGIMDPAARSSREVVATASAALKQNFDFWAAVSPQLDTLCKTRTDRYASNRSFGLTLGAGAAGVILYLFVSFYISVKRAIFALREATKRMIAGTTERFRLASRDELGAIGEAYNSINTALTQARGLKELQDEIQQLLAVVSDASDGDFTVRAKVSEGALGNVSDAINLMIDNVGALIQGVQVAASRVATSSSQIQASAAQLSHGASRQSEEITNTTAAVQEMSSNIESVSNNAGAAAEAAKRAREAAEVGNRAITDVIEGMQRIRENVQGSAKKMKRLGDRSMEIASIVNTISAISDQTDMLALNAAIEAARAGEHGRGFSVVAEEVRKLAERASNATKEISKLISAIQAETNEAVAAIESQTGAVESQSKIVSNAGTSLTQIQVASTQSAELINEISLAAKQQVRGANGVVKAMEVVSDIATQAQTSSVQTNESTGELNRLASDLTKEVAKFKIGSEAKSALAMA